MKKKKFLFDSPKLHEILHVLTLTNYINLFEMWSYFSFEKKVVNGAYY